MSVHITVSNVITCSWLPKDIERAVIRELTLPNPEYVSRQRMNKWLGATPPSLCLAKLVDGVRAFPRGILESLISKLKAAGVAHTIDDRRLKMEPIDITFHGDLRPYQTPALETMSKYGSGVLVAPCGSGKTALGMALISYWRQPSLILVHTKDLQTQTCDAVRHWLHVEPGMIGDGKWDVQPVTVALVQSLASRPEQTAAISQMFGLVLLDEAHHASATSFMHTIQQFPAAFRFGLTATPTRRDGLGPFVVAVIGPIRHTITADALKDAGTLVTPLIRWISTEFRCARDLEWSPLIGELVCDHERNNQIVELAVKLIDEGRQIILLSERVAHAEMLARVIEGIRPGRTALIVGSMKKAEREDAMKKVRSEGARLLVSTKLADEGLDAPGLDALILATPSRDAGRTTQRVGRILRSVLGKPQPVVCDIVDAHVGLLASQARTRFFECYRKLSPDCRLPEWLERRPRKEAA